MSIEYAREMLNAEAAAIIAVRDRLDERFVRIVDMICACQGRVCMCGMGKAGIVAQKIAATLSSTGTPAYYLHPADALHGDLGMVSARDIALIISNSGESEEVTKLLPYLRAAGADIAAVTASERSTLAAHADVILAIGKIDEACPLGLAPSATTTAMLALGDAIALAVMRRKGFEAKDYAKLHPAGALGRRLLPVENAMRTGDAVAIVAPGCSVKDAILAITQARAGAAVVADTDGRVLGIFCDGDLRRGLQAGGQFLEKQVGEVMSSGCITVKVGTYAGQVLDMMRERRIADVPVVDTNGKLVGVADLKGLIASL